MTAGRRCSPSRDATVPYQPHPTTLHSITDCGTSSPGRQVTAHNPVTVHNVVSVHNPAVARNAVAVHGQVAALGRRRQARSVLDPRERGSGTVLAAGLALVVLAAAALVMLLAQSAVQASRAASAADLAALAGADALRGITVGQPCVVAGDVASRHAARVVSCIEGPGQTLEVRTELKERSVLGAATGHSRAGPPP